MIGKRIRELRKHLKLNQTNFTASLGIAPNTLSDYENNKTPVPEVVIIGICYSHNVNRTWLETGEGKMFRTSYERGPREHGEAVPDVEAHADHVIRGITQEEHDLLEKVLDVIRGKWTGKYEVSLYQNIESFYAGAMAEAGREYKPKIEGKPPPAGMKRGKQ